MNEFKHPNFAGGFICPVCKSSKDLPVVLVPVRGTESDGTVEAKQAHAECYRLVLRMNKNGSADE